VYPVIRRIPRNITRVTTKVIVSDNTMKMGRVGRSMRILEMIFFLSRNTVEDRVTVFANAVHGISHEMR
jgi:hypothetical protein